MESHFILRFSKNFEDQLNLNESKIERLDNDKIKLTYKNKVYPGIVIRLPCILESQKTLDNKQFYKVCDISTLVVIYPNEDVDLEEERKHLQLSGLSPPMKFVKSRRFKKKNDKFYQVEEVERKLQEILERDRKATKVEIVNDENSEDTEEIANLAAEIENNIKEEKVEVQQEAPKESPEVLDLLKQIEEQEKKVNEALNPILKQRFQKFLDELKTKLDEKRGNLL